MTIKARIQDDVPALMAEADKLYEKITQKWPEKNKITVTRDRIVTERGWKDSLPIIADSFERVLRELNYFYIPKLMIPGPVHVFPIRSLTGGYDYAQTKPGLGSILFGTDKKYRFIGIRPFTPNWLGSNPETIAAVIKYRAVLVVEGPFDLLACRLLCPDLPIMSPLTKKIGKKHEAYLRMLGVKKLFLLYDNELATKDDQELGAGNLAAEYQSKQITTMQVLPLVCPCGDPSEALKTSSRALQLKELIKRTFGIRLEEGDLDDRSE